MQLERPQGARWQGRPQSPSRGVWVQLLVGGGAWSKLSQGCQHVKSETPIPGALLQMEAATLGKWNPDNRGPLHFNGE